MVTLYTIAQGHVEVQPKTKVVDAIIHLHRDAIINVARQRLLIRAAYAVALVSIATAVAVH